MHKIRVTKSLVYTIYLNVYLISLIFCLVLAYFDGGFGRLILAIVISIFTVVLFFNPYIFYRILNRLEVHIPQFGSYGPNSEDWKWWLCSLLYGLGPIVLNGICIFKFLLRLPGHV